MSGMGDTGDGDLAGPNRTEGQREKSERTRARLIEAAAGLFAEKGFGDTSVQDIAEAAGISRGSIHWHFGSKQGLLLAVVEASLARFESQIAPFLASGGARGMRDVVYAFRDYIRHNPPIGRLFYILLFEGLGPRPELLPDYAEFLARFRRLAAAWARRAQSAGLLPMEIDPEGAAVSVAGTLLGLNLQWQVDPTAFDLDGAADTLAALFERAFAATDRGSLG